MNFTEQQRDELTARKLIKEEYCESSWYKCLVTEIDRLRSLLKQPEQEHWNDEGHWNAPHQLPPVSGEDGEVWLNIKSTDTKVFGEESFKAKRVSAISSGPRNVWEVEDESGQRAVVTVVSWQYV